MSKGGTGAWTGECKVVNGKPLVLVPWYPTWEPPDEYSREEVERVKRQYASQIPRKRQGRPPLRKIGGISDGSLYISTTNTPDSRHVLRGIILLFVPAQLSGSDFAHRVCLQWQRQPATRA
jgi:hypothetical protein